MPKNIRDKKWHKNSCLSYVILSIFCTLVTKKIESVMVDQPYTCATHVHPFCVKLMPLSLCILFHFFVVQLLSSLFHFAGEGANSRMVVDPESTYP